MSGASLPFTGKPARKRAVSSRPMPFCPQADGRAPTNASVITILQTSRRIHFAEHFLGFMGVAFATTSIPEQG